MTEWFTALSTDDQLLAVFALAGLALLLTWPALGEKTYPQMVTSAPRFRRVCQLTGAVASDSTVPPSGVERPAPDSAAPARPTGGGGTPSTP